MRLLKHLVITSFPLPKKKLTTVAGLVAKIGWSAEASCYSWQSKVSEDQSLRAV